MADNPKRLARVVFDLSYVVDADNPDMVEEAKNCIYEDVMSALKYNEVFNYIEVQQPDPTLKEEDIPEFLRTQDEDEE